MLVSQARSLSITTLNMTLHEPRKSPTAVGQVESRGLSKCISIGSLDHVIGRVHSHK